MQRELRNLQSSLVQTASNSARAQRYASRQQMRELRNLESSLIQTNTNSARAQRYANRQARSQDAANTSRTRRSETRNNRAITQENRNAFRALMAGRSRQANFQASTSEQFEKIISMFRDPINRGERFLVRTATNKYYTLTASNFSDLITSINRERNALDITGQSRISDDALVEDALSYGSFSVSSRSESGGYQFRSGAFFPYTHKIDSTHVQEVLAKLGCFKSIEAKNYKRNCLYNALESAGVHQSVLESLKVCFLRRTISRQNLKMVAENNDLTIRLHTCEGKRDVLVYGEGTHQVDLGLIQDHYIHLFKTDITKFALDNYEQLRHKERWWEFKRLTKRDASCGMNTINLLKYIASSPFGEKINITTEGIFSTQFYDKVRGTEFQCLAFSNKQVRPFHAERNPLFSNEGVTLDVSRQQHPSITAKVKKEINKLVSFLSECKNSERHERYKRRNETKDANFKKYLSRLGKEPPEPPTSSFQRALSQSAEDRYKESDTKEYKTIMALRENESDWTRKRLDLKCATLGLDEKEELKLRNKSRPVVKNVFFDFEASTRESHTPAELIRRCEQQIRQTSDDPDRVMERIHEKCEGLDPQSQADIYQQECPHVAYQVCWAECDDGAPRFNDAPVHCFNGHDCAQKFLESICEKYGAEEGDKTPTVRFLAHNITYDISFLWPHLTRSKYIERGTSIVCGTARFVLFAKKRGKEKNKLIDICFTDTWKMISMPLAQFGKSFKLSQAKEVLPYDLYTNEFVSSGAIATDQDLLRLNFPQYNELLSNLKAWGCEVEGGFDMMKYSQVYCEADVRVLMKGFDVFRSSLLDAFDMDALHFPTISSLADALFAEKGCYKDVVALSSVPQKFIAEASIGGRVMCANNEPRALIRRKPKPHAKEDADEEMQRAFNGKQTNELDARKVADFDAVGLYASAMKRIPGFLKGAPKVWDETIDLSKVDGYFLKIRVNKVARKWRFPITRLKEESENLWTNDLEGKEIVVDRFTLEDLVRHSGVTYTILQGYYFDEGRNNAVNSVIQELFQMRKRYKAEGNPLQIVVKLIMNAAYGITGMKAPEDDVHYVHDAQKDKFIDTHFNEIRCIVKMTNHEWRIETYKEIESHFNRQHVACEILSMSKNIMNEVMCLAEEIGAPIWYTDTDSMHIDGHWVKGENESALGAAFREKYGRELIGKDLGQFHTDFDMGGSYMIEGGELKPCTKKCKGELLAVESMFLGKKCYIDKLQDEDGQQAYHIRLKGIKTASILAKCTQQYGGDPMKLYLDLFRGKAVRFNLSEGGPCFKVNKNHTMSSVPLTRTVAF